MMTIDYKKLGCPVVAGQYAYKDMLIDVGASQISIWESDPTYRFALMPSYDNRFTLYDPVEVNAPA